MEKKNRNQQQLKIDHDKHYNKNVDKVIRGKGIWRLLKRHRRSQRKASWRKWNLNYTLENGKYLDMRGHGTSFYGKRTKTKRVKEVTSGLRLQ